MSSLGGLSYLKVLEEIEIVGLNLEDSKAVNNLGSEVRPNFIFNLYHKAR